MTAPVMAENQFVISKSRKMAAHKRKTIALTTNKKSPSVMMVSGKVRNATTGQTKILASPMTMVATNAAVKFLSRNPGTTMAVSQSAKPDTIHFPRRLNSSSMATNHNICS